MSSSHTSNSTSQSIIKTRKAPVPWSKRHKQVTKAAKGGLRYSSLSNSFAEPPTTKELIEWSRQRGDDALVEEYLNHPLDYTTNGGSWDLREAISNLYGPKIAAANILVFPGAQVALQTAARAICHHEMHAITFVPGYQSVVTGPIHAGAESVTQIELQASNGWQIEMKQVQDAMQGHTGYIVINEPYNPAGSLMSKQNQQELIQLARNHSNSVHILCDEVYRWLEHDPADQLPAMAEAYEKGLSVVTVSKPWGCCGITIGWIATQDVELLDEIWNLQYFGTACMSRASELQAIMCLRESDRILSRNLAIIRHNKALLQQFMTDYAEWFEWVSPNAGAIAAIRFKGPMSSRELGDALATQAQVGIKPAYCFTDKMDIGKEHDYFRVGFGESKMPEALNAFRRFVEENKAKWSSSSAT